MGDGRAERPRLGPLRLDMDPLMIQGGVGKGVDAILGHFKPIGWLGRLADSGLERFKTLFKCFGSHAISLISMEGAPIMRRFEPGIQAALGILRPR